jgi:hypothetical protein
MLTHSQIALAIDVDPTWIGFGGIHGGMLTALLMRGATTDGSSPLAITAHMYRPVAPGRIEIEAGPRNGGRTGSVQTWVGDRATALVRVATDGDGPRRAPIRRADPAPPPLDCPRFALPPELVPFGQHVEIRPIDDARALAGGTEPGFDVWIRLTDPEGLTRAEQAVVLLDALPPGLFAVRTTPVLIPTAEFTVHLAPFAESAWYRLRHRTTWATDDLCVDDSELFTDNGELAAQARQLRRITHPRD